MRAIDRAIKFYSDYPTGQYDDEAVLALRFCKAVLDGMSSTTEPSEQIKELQQVLGREMT